MISSGKIVQIIGAVVDVEFPRDQIPKIYDALKLDDVKLTLEVQQQLGDGVVRTIAMGASEGLRRGLAVANTGKAISVPNHPRIAAEILRPYVRDEVTQAILFHQEFQGRHYFHHFDMDPNLRDNYRDMPWYALAERFADEALIYIDPVECIDCGACVPVCPVSAIFALDDLPEKWADFTARNAAYYKK